METQTRNDSEEEENRLQLVLETIKAILAKPKTARTPLEHDLWSRFRGYHIAFLLPADLVEQLYAQIVAGETSGPRA